MQLNEPQDSLDFVFSSPGASSTLIDPLEIDTLGVFAPWATPLVDAKEEEEEEEYEYEDEDSEDEEDEEEDGALNEHGHSLLGLYCVVFY